MTTNLKYVTNEELEVGKFYSDVRYPDHNLQTILEYVGKTETSLLFRYISGKETYLKNKNGLIGFPNSHSGGWYYDESIQDKDGLHV